MICYLVGDQKLQRVFFVSSNEHDIQKELFFHKEKKKKSWLCATCIKESLFFSSFVNLSHLLNNKNPQHLPFIYSLFVFWTHSQPYLALVFFLFLVCGKNWKKKGRKHHLLKGKDEVQQ